LLERVTETFWKNFLDDPTFSSYLNASPHLTNFTAEKQTLQAEAISDTVRVIDQTGYFCVNSS